ncbi:MAG TPA: NAD(P)/FAD-dependent oxidoreductase [Polyangia bacterium]|nr:NAD(P)/FAD-dependent oxidoreductase [Polyangia bacterium]
MVVVGAGPNGLAAAITLARAGRRVLLLEAAEQVGGGVRSAALTLPGFVHDVCSAVYPLGAGSPFFRSLPLARHGVDWVHPPLALAHPLDGGRVAVVARSLEQTAAGLGRDGRAYRTLVGWLAGRWGELLGGAGWRALRPGAGALLGLLRALGSAQGVAARRLRTSEGRALFAGLGAHGMQPLDRLGTAGFAMVLAAGAHAVGWPFVRGGAQRLADGLAGVLRGHGGVIRTGHPVRSLDELPPARAILLDVSPGQLLRLAGDRLPRRYRQRLARFRRGPAAFKIDYVLEAPIPWAAEACRQAGVVHVGGPAEEIAAAMAAAWRGPSPSRPFVLVAQPSLFDDGRVPPGSRRHTAWAYCHLPTGSTDDMTRPIEEQIERFAPGFQARIAARHVLAPAGLEAHDANLEQGDIGGGACDLRQLIFRPAPRRVPWSTPDPALFLCSASTPPGPGVHGLCGHWAARAVLRRLKG